MRNTRKQPQRVPPPLLSGNERIEGQGILDEFPGEDGVVLWKTFRSVRLWAELETQQRKEMISRDAYSARLAHLEAAAGLDDVVDALAGLADMFERQITRPMVASRCKVIERWAEGQQAGRTALEFGQLAALASADDASVAVDVAKRGRDLAEYARAESWYWQAIVRARRSSDWEAYVRSMLGLGVTHLLRGNYPAARRTIERGRRRARRQGLRAHEAMALHELTVVAIRTNSLKPTIRFGRKTLEAYGPNHPQLPWLGHDLAVFWMNQGYFQSALDVFLKIPAEIGSPADQLARFSSIARAAGAVGKDEVFSWAVAEAEQLIDVPIAASRATPALVEIARGALSLGAIDAADAAASRALRLAQSRAEAEQAWEAEALLEEIRSDRAASRSAQITVPPEVEQLTSDLVESLAATGAL